MPEHERDREADERLGERLADVGPEAVGGDQVADAADHVLGLRQHERRDVEDAMTSFQTTTVTTIATAVRDPREVPAAHSLTPPWRSRRSSSSVSCWRSATTLSWKPGSAVTSSCRGRADSTSRDRADAPRPRGQQHDAVGQEHGLGDRVRDQHDRRVGGAGDALELHVHLVARHRVERPERLVHQQDLGVVAQRARDRDALAHAARELARQRLLEALQADELAELVRTPAALLLVHLAQQQRQPDVVLDRVPGEQVARPGRRGRACAARRRRGGRRSTAGGAPTRHLAAGGLDQPGEDPQHRRLPAARLADERDELLLADPEVDVLERQRLAVARPVARGRRRAARSRPRPPGARRSRGNRPAPAPPPARAHRSRRARQRSPHSPCRRSPSKSSREVPAADSRSSGRSSDPHVSRVVRTPFAKNMRLGSGGYGPNGRRTPPDRGVPPDRRGSIMLRSGRIEEVMTVRESSGYGVVRRAIAEERCVVLDGGVATELPHRHGAGRRAAVGRSRRWPPAPTTVHDVHRRYVDAGVDVLTTNTWGLPTVLAGDGQISDELHRPVHWMEVARRGVRVARQAIADGGREGECAVAFSLNGDLDGPDGPETVSLLQRALAGDPPDLFVLETLSRACARRCSRSSRRCSTPRSRCGCRSGAAATGCAASTASTGAARRATRSAGPRGASRTWGVAALLVNCIPPDHVDGDGRPTCATSPTCRSASIPTSATTRAPAGGSRPRSAARSTPRWRCAGAPRARRSSAAAAARGPSTSRRPRDALTGTAPGPRAPRGAGAPSDDGRAAAAAPRTWTDRRGRPLHPLAVPAIAKHPGVVVVDPRHATCCGATCSRRASGAHQRCLDIGCGAGPADRAARAQRRRARPRDRRRRARGRQHARQRVPQRRRRPRQRRDRRPLPVGAGRALRGRSSRTSRRSPIDPAAAAVLAPAHRLLGPRPRRPGDRQAAATRWPRRASRC